MLKRDDIEKLEENNLAPYAAKSKYTRGFRFPQKVAEFRTVYARDRDRIVHSTAFRRLEYKTQVFVNHEGDYYRTRLTHTIEVVQIARSIARPLMLNEDLTEAIALAHDIGHTPFGHSGEEMLNELMKDFGGFEHNLQGLRVVDELEIRYPEFNGLNLSYETREGIIKHKTEYDNPDVEYSSEFPKDESPTLETQVVSIADEIAYNSHDLDDGIKSGLITIEQLNEIPIWGNIYNHFKKILKTENNELIKKKTIRFLIGIQIKDVIENSAKTIEDLKISSLKDVRTKPTVITFSNEMNEKNRALKDYLYNKLYRHYKVVKMADKAKRFIKDLFEVYVKNPAQLPPDFQVRIKNDETERVVCDYIAGMTDRFAQDEYTRLFVPYAKM
ncbi:MAG: deoxyguanosinetriphosphate triphosphohydrolase [Candidatus Cloacimonas sp. 4484_209]|nr:MAG: deoxyguanosinetriphosphate triphosphohydrolase [Candidatus Cloacimonas sp. 4484_209]